MEEFQNLPQDPDATGQSEECLANEILCHHGSDVIAEKMDYRALQLRAKDASHKPDGRFRSRKRFGKSLGKHAPGRFLSILGRKLSYIDKAPYFVDTWKFKASQYDHVVGDYEKVSLNTRSKIVGGYRVQRDLYSAFLLYNALDSQTVDRDHCLACFKQFLKYHDRYIIALLSDKSRKPSSFGLGDFRYLLTA